MNNHNLSTKLVVTQRIIKKKKLFEENQVIYISISELVQKIQKQIFSEYKQFLSIMNKLSLIIVMHWMYRGMKD